MPCSGAPPQADILQMEPPELYVRQNPTPNAYTLAISGRKPFVVVHTSLLELLSPPELQAVLAHGEDGLGQRRWRAGAEGVRGPGERGTCLSGGSGVQWLTLT